MSSKDKIVYHGAYQVGDTILQKLEGPYGQGAVDYSNGDHFEGFFHLSYAHINGPAYAADGRYQFADGSVIEHAWINTSANLKIMDLIGVYRIQHPHGPDTLTPFYRRKRHGLELVLAETPYAIEWYEDEKMQELEVRSHTFEIISKDIAILTITLKNGTVVMQKGGDVEPNGYGNYSFKTGLKGSITYPDGTSLEYFGYNLKYLKPYNGYITVRNTNGKYHKEEWAKGKMVQSQNEEWDKDAAKTIELPEPFNKNNMMTAKVWNEHIEYDWKTWVYDGEMKNDRPEGFGVLVGNKDDTKGRRYEGEFKDGLCHGIGKFTYPAGGITQDGEWVEGVFLEKDAPTKPIMLHVSGNATDDKMVEAKVGRFPYFTGFEGMRIDHIKKRHITFAFNDDIRFLTPGETLHYHQFCTYDGNHYYLDITWVK